MMNSTEVVRLQQAEKLTLSIDAWRLHYNEKVELIELQLEPGEEIEKHTNPMDVIFYLTAGQGELSTENSVYFIEKNESIFLGKGLNRCWRNTGDTVLKILVFKF
jgi:quercetin dioxygenase-like cupin family protein